MSRLVDDKGCQGSDESTIKIEKITIKQMAREREFEKTKKTIRQFKKKKKELKLKAEENTEEIILFKKQVDESIETLEKEQEENENLIKIVENSLKEQS